MNCPSDETLFEIVDLRLSSAPESPLHEHVKECPQCSEKLRSAVLALKLVESSMVTEVPDDMFRMARSRIAMHESRKRTLQFGFAAVVIMIACISNMSLLPSDAPPTIQSAADESPSPLGTESHTETLVSVSANSDSIVVPVESTSDNISLFLIYPTVKVEVPDKSSFRNQPITYLARS